LARGKNPGGFKVLAQQCNPKYQDDAAYRSLDTMADDQRWCEENLPDWLGYGRAG